MSKSELKSYELKTGLQAFINQVVASNLTTAYYLHSEEEPRSEKCMGDVLKTWIAFSNVQNRYYTDKLKEMGEA
jgi:hypothetical protein